MNVVGQKIYSFISDFKERKGGFIMGSDLLIKINGFILSILIVRLLDKENFGLISYSRSLLFPFLAFVGMGANHALLRFGPIRSSRFEKWTIYKYSQKTGIIGSLLLIIIFFIISFYASNNMPQARIYIFILSFQIFSTHLILTLKSLMRILKLNKLYAFSGITQSGLLLILGLSFTYLFGGIGYVLSIVICPLLCYFLYDRFFKNFPLINFNKLKGVINKSAFWRYGLYVGLGSIASQLLFDIGIIMSGTLNADPEQIAMYRVASIIPYNLLFIPKSVLKTDYIFLTENYKSRSTLLSYIKKYWAVFSVISILISIPMLIFPNFILTVFFGSKYTDGVEIFRILTVSVIIAIMFRKLFGSILLAVGKANWNVINAVSTIIINLILNYLLITKFGITGAAYSIFLSFCFGSLISAVLLGYYIKYLTK